MLGPLHPSPGHESTLTMGEPLSAGGMSRDASTAFRGGTSPVAGTRGVDRCSSRSIDVKATWRAGGDSAARRVRRETVVMRMRCPPRKDRRG